jgi:hypothetical protein
MRFNRRVRHAQQKSMRVKGTPGKLSQPPPPPQSQTHAPRSLCSGPAANSRFSSPLAPYDRMLGTKLGVGVQLRRLGAHRRGGGDSLVSTVGSWGCQRFWISRWTARRLARVLSGRLSWRGANGISRQTWREYFPDQHLVIEFVSTSTP